MGWIDVVVERWMAHSPEMVYAFLASYRWRPAILPPRMIDFEVYKGGKGEGTEFTYTMIVGGKEREHHMLVEEPEPGTTIVERDINSSLVHTWTLSPKDGGTLVRIQTRWQGARFIKGFFERRFAPVGLRGVHSRMLRMLDKRLE